MGWSRHVEDLAVELDGRLMDEAFEHGPSSLWVIEQLARLEALEDGFVTSHQDACVFFDCDETGDGIAIDSVKLVEAFGCGTVKTGDLLRGEFMTQE